MTSSSSPGRTSGPKARQSRGRYLPAEGRHDLTHTSTSWWTELRSTLPFPTLRIKTLMYSKDILRDASPLRHLAVVWAFLSPLSLWICVPRLCRLNLDQALGPYNTFFFSPPIPLFFLPPSTPSPRLEKNPNRHTIFMLSQGAVGEPQPLSVIKS